jgi:mannose-6-phosphate isomerase-like protein (cupin superfamily)
MRPQILQRDDTKEFFSEEKCFINELSNSIADTEVSIAQARVLVDEVTRWHKLEGVTERYVILSGTGRVELADLDPRDVQAGDVVIIPPGCPQRIRNTGHEDLVFLAICNPPFSQSKYLDIDPN